MTKIALPLLKNGLPKWLFIVCLITTFQYASSYSLCTTVQSNCLICPIQCTRCDSNFTCSACSLQYFLYNGSCVSCPSYCQTCSSSTVCTQCKDPYVLSNGTCIQCVISKALTCSSSVSASSCQPQYYVNSNYCSSCLLNCKTCTSSSTCTQCIDSFYLNSTVLTCNPCPANCLTCNQYTPSVCTSCKNGYQLTTNSTCQAIDCSGLSNCIYCSATNVCGRCEMFYYWTGTSCVMGASVLCEYGASGVLPSSCINDCPSTSYKSQSSSPFVCIPYKTVKISTLRLYQLYYNAFSDLGDFQLLSNSLSSSNQLESSGEYSFSTSGLDMGVVASFYKIQLRVKYLSSSNVTMSLTSTSQSSQQTQSQSTAIPTSPTPSSISYTTHSVHSNNLKLAFSQSIKLIQLYLKIYRCPSTCLQCLNLQLCQLCVQPYYMLGYGCVSNCTVYYHFALNRTCLLNCPYGYYYVNNGTNNKFCQVCVPPCSSCLDATQCLSCINGYYFYNYTCKPTCADRYYPNPTNNTCDNCVSPCMTCTSKSTCLSCSQGYWNGSLCTTVCAAGTYGNNSTNSCELCDSSCLTCTNTSSSCSSCVSTLYLHNKQCIVNCPVRYYPSDSLPLTCISCKPPCESCTSQTSCLTCAYNFLYGSSCVTDCPAGYFSNIINNTCTQCSSTCKTCSSPNYCDSCLSGKCLSQGQCLSSCPSQAWYQLVNSTSNECACQQCKYPCKECLSASSCLSCLQGYIQGSDCLTQCPTGYHKNDTLKSCILCNTTFTNCKQCTDLRCTLCNSNYLLFMGGCLSTCPQYFYQSSEKCSRCIAPCLECSGFGVCNSCITGYILYQSQCIVSCPAGKYAYSSVVNNINVSQCAACQAPCLYCTQSATNCTFCLTSYYLYNNQCLKNCSTLLPLSTFYNQPVTSTCTKCLFPCKTCLSQYECSSCIIGYLNTADKRCKECLVGTYPNDTAGLCLQCPVSCTICYSDTYCTSCNQGYYLFQNMCISNLTVCQINGYYGIGRVCALCQQPCKTCSQSSTNCTSCLQGYTFFASSNQCLVQCPTGYYRNSTTSQCQLCSAQCTSCVGTATYCFGCATNYKLYTAQMRCLLNCPQYTYSQGAFCTSCKYPCLQCTSQTKCLSCISGSLVGTQCLSSCTSGYFSNKLSICQACSTSCKECLSSSTNCTQCPSNTYLYNSTCVSTCPSRTFPETQSQKCISCMGSCYECSSHINCTSCSNGLFFYISQLTNYGQCVSSCPNGYYPSQANSLCLPCSPQCLTCQNSSSCLLCNNGKVMYLGKCYTQCPQRMYNYQGVCQDCQQPCFNCTDMMTCTSCKNDSYLLVGSAQCIQGPMCPVGYFLLQNQPKCNSQCPTSFYHLKTNRTCNSRGCADDQFKGLDYYCYDQCPSNFIANQLLYCQACYGSDCSNGLFFSVKYSIRNDDVLVKVYFTQAPKYLLGQPRLVISPNVSYSIQDYLPVSKSDHPTSSQTPLVSTTTSAYTEGSNTLTLYLTPTTSLQQTYFKISFQNPLQSFTNPLQHSSSTFFLQGYDKYDQALPDMSSFGILALFCSLMGLFKNPYMTDFAQLLWILALNNIHYPYNLRTFLESTKIASLHGFMGVQQPNMDGSGKFAYVTNGGLLQNAFGNIIIMLVGLLLAGLGFALWKFLQWYVQYSKLSSKVSPNEQNFLSKQPTHQQQPSNHPTDTTLDSSTLTLSIRILHFLQQAYTLQNIKLLFLNRFIYFNYLPVCLFTFLQLSTVDTDSSINTMAFVLAVLMMFLIIFYPFAFVHDKPKFTFLYVRKVVTALSLILSVNYPAYCIGVLSVCNITASLLILAYKLEKWKIETRLHAIGEGLQLVLMILFAIFIMIGEGYRTTFKAYFSYIIIIFAVAILLYYVLFALFLLTLWLVKKICGRDFITEWIQADKKDDSDGTDSQTLNSSMKDHQEKKLQPQIMKQTVNWDKIEETFKGKEDQNFIQGQINDFIQTRPIGISPSKINLQETANNKELFWNYDTNSQEEQKQVQKQPPKMLIRCVNEFSDFDHQDEVKEQK